MLTLEKMQIIWFRMSLSMTSRQIGLSQNNIIRFNRKEKFQLPLAYRQKHNRGDTNFPAESYMEILIIYFKWGCFLKCYLFYSKPFKASFKWSSTSLLTKIKHCFSMYLFTFKKKKNYLCLVWSILSLLWH